MKLLKKMSAFVVALTFLFVFSIKANAAESYKVGDKVLFGDFGGHVIEDSDSSSNTVKVYVDGWNKTKEEWQTYWTNKFTSSDGKIYAENINFDAYIKNSVENKNGFEYGLPFGSIANIFSYWLLSENYNILGPSKDGVSFPISKNVIEQEKEIPAKYIVGFAYGHCSSETDEPLATLVPIVESNNDVKYVYRTSNCVTFNYFKKPGIYYDFNDNNEYYLFAGYYLTVSLDKSNLTKVVDKCSDYSDSYKITYETNGGDKIDAVSVTGNKDLAIPKREGYIFDGWYTDSIFKNKVSSVTSTEKKTDTCIQGFNDVTVYAKWKRELKEEKVNIVADEKVLSNIKNIEVKLQDKVTANIVGTLKTFTAYDITLKDNDGKSVEPSGKVKLSLEIPKDYDKNNIGVYRVDGENLIAYETKINGDYAEIETDHFSTYIVGEKAEAKQEEVTTTTTAKTTKKVNNETVSKDNSTSKNIQNPNTGDNMIVFFIVGLLLIGGITITFKKIKTVK